MKIFRFIFFTLLLLILLTVGFAFWFCTGSFVYQSSFNKEFAINDPITTICKRAMNIKMEPETPNHPMPKIDMEKVKKDYPLGKPIEIEYDHPTLGKLKARFKINLKIGFPNSLAIRGEMVSFEPKEFKKFGKTIANVENITFELKVSAKNDTGKDVGVMGAVFGLPSKSGKAMVSYKTIIELKTDVDVRVHFRDLGFLRSRIDLMTEDAKQELIHEIETFLDENLRKSNEEKPQKPIDLNPLPSPQDEPEDPDPQAKNADESDDEPDISGLDEEFD